MSTGPACFQGMTGRALSPRTTSTRKRSAIMESTLMPAIQIKLPLG